MFAINCTWVVKKILILIKNFVVRSNLLNSICMFWLSNINQRNNNAILNIKKLFIHLIKAIVYLLVLLLRIYVGNDRWHARSGDSREGRRITWLQLQLPWWFRLHGELLTYFINNNKNNDTKRFVKLLCSLINYNWFTIAFNANF